MEPRVAVCAIAKDEAPNAKGWMEAVAEADGVFVADTGSSDQTPKRLRELGAVVSEIDVNPWRFDVARNEAMSTVPDDYEILCVFDLDERPDAGWCAKVKAAWQGGVNQLEYREVFSHRPDGSPGMVLPKRKIHNRDFEWRAPVHEALVPRDGKDAHIGRCPITVHHWPDPAKSRGQYLALLKLATEEAPDDERMAYYYGRELYYAGRWAEAVAELQRHQAFPAPGYTPERAAGLSIIGECYDHLGMSVEAEAAFLRACAEHPYGREPWLALARRYLAGNSFAGAYWAARRALAVAKRLHNYIENESSWKEGPHDIIAVAAWYLGRKDEARDHANIAITYAPFDARIQQNHAMMEGVTLPQSTA